MILLSPTVLIPATLLLLVLTLLSRLRSPLSRLPGPWYTRLTSLPLKWHEFHAHRTRYIHALHRQYGPVVRLSPNEASFASAAAVKEIYCSGGSGYDKTEFYDLFTVYGRRTMFSTRGKDDHARRKRMLADRYANTNVMRAESLGGIEERSGRFVGRIAAAAAAAASTGALDVYTALHAYAFDCASHHLFHPLGADSLRRRADEDVMLEVTTDSSLQNRLLRYYAPALHGLVGGALARVAPPRETPLADRFVLENSARGGEARPFTLLSRLSDKGWGLDTLGIAAECLDHMAAGIDTTGDALCFLMWELSQPRSLAVQERLREELRQAAAAEEDKEQEAAGPGWERLRYLDAVVMEGLRCFPAIPMSLPRYVPAGGRTVDGHFVPQGTIVSCQPYTVHRLDETVFPQPDRFDPERWLAAAGGVDAERKRLFFAFSNGGRGCVGKHLALAEMKVLLRDVYSRYRTLPHESMREEEMEMADQLISARPAGQRCLLRFVADDGRA